jgi:hypothetical protein
MGTPLNFPQVDTLIAQFEGFGSSAAPSITSGNNPGSIMWGDWAEAHGATGQNPNGTAVFPDLTTGFGALDSLVSQKIAAGIDTPAALIESWAPASAPGNSAASTGNYADYLAKGLGIGIGDKIPGAAAAATATGQSGSWLPSLPDLSKILDFDPFEAIPAYKGAKDATGSAVATATGAASWLANLSLAQIVILLLGLILLIAGLFSLRPVQGAVTTVIRTAKRGAAILT